MVSMIGYEQLNDHSEVQTETCLFLGSDQSKILEARKVNMQRQRGPH